MKLVIKTAVSALMVLAFPIGLGFIAGVTCRLMAWGWWAAWNVFK